MVVSVVQFIAISVRVDTAIWPVGDKSQNTPELGVFLYVFIALRRKAAVNYTQTYVPSLEAPRELKLLV